MYAQFKQASSGRLDVAYIGEGDWFNPYTEQFETVEGVWCECYECKSDVHNQHEVAVFYTKAEFRVHQNERQKSYNEYTIRKAELQERAHTKETEALEEHGRSSSDHSFRPTYWTVVIR